MCFLDDEINKWAEKNLATTRELVNLIGWDNFPCTNIMYANIWGCFHAGRKNVAR